MKQLVADYEKTTGNKVSMSFGSSGKFYAQIMNGAPFQVFFSADQAKPQALERANMIVPNSRFTYAIGALALWSAQPGFIDTQLYTLRQGNFRKIALANPKLAPYGAAAAEVLAKLNLVDATRAKWVQGENIAQTYQFVSTGNAELGFVALSQIMSHGNVDRGSSWVVPAELYQPIKQDAVLLNNGAHSPGAQALLAFIRSEQARSVIESYGYQTP